MSSCYSYYGCRGIMCTGDVIITMLSYLIQNRQLREEALIFVIFRFSEGAFGPWNVPPKGSDCVWLPFLDQWCSDPGIFPSGSDQKASIRVWPKEIKWKFYSKVLLGWNLYREEIVLWMCVEYERQLILSTGYVYQNCQQFMKQLHR